MALGFNDGIVNRVPDKLFSTNVKFDTNKFMVDTLEQRGSKGLFNNKISEWRASFKNRSKADIDNIVNFLRLKKGYTSFDLVVPNENASPSEQTIKVVCEDITQVYEDFNVYSCTAVFRRVYND
jgi:phage-related protein